MRNHHRVTRQETRYQPFPVETICSAVKVRKGAKTEVHLIDTQSGHVLARAGGKRAERATCVLVGRNAGGLCDIWGLRGDTAKAEVEAATARTSRWTQWTSWVRNDDPASGTLPAKAVGYCLNNTRDPAWLAQHHQQVVEFNLSGACDVNVLAITEEVSA